MSRTSGAPAPTASHRRDDGELALAVFAATLDELRLGGYAELSLPSVAARAGVPRETVYRRWRSKQQLTLAALHAYARELDVTETGRLRDDLVAHVTALVALLGHPGASDVLRGLIVTAEDHEVARTALRVGPIAARRAAVSRTVRRAQQEGRCPRTVDARAVADALVGALCYRLVITDEPLDADLSYHIVDLLVGPLTAPATPSTPDVRFDHHAEPPPARSA